MEKLRIVYKIGESCLTCNETHRGISREHSGVCENCGGYFQVCVVKVTYKTHWYYGDRAVSTEYHRAYKGLHESYTIHGA